MPANSNHHEDGGHGASRLCPPYEIVLHQQKRTRSHASLCAPGWIRTSRAAAKPDGYTISQIPITVFRLPLMQEVSWDPAKDFTYI
ncbi:hypothetical protein MOV75_37970, partial [Bradyrhizobium sp. PRIMUS42]|nr:hypothetical protein [Bradyrhizobium sp. PRIMUS42]